MFGLIGSLIGGGLNFASQMATNKQNAQLNAQQRNDYLQNISSNNQILDYYFKHGSLDGIDFNRDVSQVSGDFLTPFLNMSSLELQKKGMDLNEQQFKISKDMAYNGTQIKMQDLKKAGLSPLLASGNSSTFNAVSTGTSPVSGSRPNGYSTIPMQAPSLDPSVLSSMADFNLKNAQSKLLNKQADTEEEKTKLTVIETEKKEIEKDLIGSQIELSKIQIENLAQDLSEKIYNFEQKIELGIPFFDLLPDYVKEFEIYAKTLGIQKGTDKYNKLQFMNMTTLMNRGEIMNSAMSIGQEALQKAAQKIPIFGKWLKAWNSNRKIKKQGKEKEVKKNLDLLPKSQRQDYLDSLGKKM